jgi:hypothetical protein
MVFSPVVLSKKAGLPAFSLYKECFPDVMGAYT